MDKDKCAQCGWREKDHRNGYCYHYSDENTDYFYNDRKFISEKSLKWKKYNKAFNGKIIIQENDKVEEPDFEIWWRKNYPMFHLSNIKDAAFKTWSHFQPSIKELEEHTRLRERQAASEAWEAALRFKKHETPAMPNPFPDKETYLNERFSKSA